MGELGPKLRAEGRSLLVADRPQLLVESLQIWREIELFELVGFRHLSSMDSAARAVAVTDALSLFSAR